MHLLCGEANPVISLVYHLWLTRWKTYIKKRIEIFLKSNKFNLVKKTDFDHFCRHWIYGPILLAFDFFPSFIPQKTVFLYTSTDIHSFRFLYIYVWIKLRQARSLFLAYVKSISQTIIRVKSESIKRGLPASI